MRVVRGSSKATVARLGGGVLALVLTLMGCAGPRALDSADAGRTAAYAPGVPDFDLEVVPAGLEGEPGAALYLSIPHRSLRFVREADTTYRATFETMIRVLDSRGRTRLREIGRMDTVRVATQAATQRFDPVVRRQTLTLDPSTYQIEVVLIDLESEAQAVRRQRVNIPDPAETPLLGGVRLEGYRPGAGTFEPVVSLHVPEVVDSLRAVLELYAPAHGSEPPTGARFRLLQMPADTAAADPLYWQQGLGGLLIYNGIRYDQADTLQVTERRLPPFEDDIRIEFVLPPLDPGVYRLEMEVDAAQAYPIPPREVIVQGHAFPAVTTLDEMTQALAYIAFDDELERIRSAETPREQKARFDAFWGRLFSNRAKAAAVVEQYYSRVEEANLRFTSHKAGWKTDRGLLYILMGPPLFVEERPDREIWHYSYADRDPLRTYVFERLQPMDEASILEHHVLQRRAYYDRVWRQAVERWRRGEAM